MQTFVGMSEYFKYIELRLLWHTFHPFVLLCTDPGNQTSFTVAIFFVLTSWIIKDFRNKYKNFGFCLFANLQKFFLIIFSLLNWRSLHMKLSNTEKNP